MPLFSRRSRFDLQKARILLPSLGHPCFYPKDGPAFSALVVARDSGVSCLDLEEGFELTSVPDPGQRYSLETVSVEKKEGLPERKSAAGALSTDRRLSFYEVRLRAGRASIETPPSHRRFLLFNLSHPQIETSFHSLVWLFHAWAHYRFCFIADTHVGSMWDLVQKGFQKLAQEEAGFAPGRAFELGRVFSRGAFEDNFVNPNRNLIHFIELANEKASRGQLDFIILGGDVVDYQFQVNRSGRDIPYAETNFSLFERIVTGRYEGGRELEVPLLLIPGNHDYRLHPYQVHHYPLDRCGLHDLQKRFFLRNAWGQKRGSYSLKDLRAVSSRAGKKHLLETYFLHLSPETDSSWDIRGTKFIFLDTGKDAFRSIERIQPRRWGNLLRAARHSWLFPNSEGLSDRQAQFLSRESQKQGVKNLILVLHAGLINTPHDFPHEEETSGTVPPKRMKPGERREFRLPILVGDYLRSGEGFKQKIGLENALLASGLNFGGLFQNQGSLLLAASARAQHVLALTGHFHRPLEVRLDKNTLGLFCHDYSRQGWNGSWLNDSSYFLGHSALAHVQARYETPGWPEFSIIEIAADEIKSIKKESLNAPPFDAIRFHVRKQQNGGAAAQVILLSELLTDELNHLADSLRMAVTFIVMAKRPKKPQPDFPLEISPRDVREVLASQRGWISEREKKEYFGRRPAFSFHSFFCRFAAEIEFDFRPLTSFLRRPEVIVIAEYLAEDKNRFKSLRLAWHPLSLSLGF